MTRSERTTRRSWKRSRFCWASNGFWIRPTRLSNSGNTRSGNPWRPAGNVFLVRRTTRSHLHRFRGCPFPELTRRVRGLNQPSTEILSPPWRNTVEILGRPNPRQTPTPSPPNFPPVRNPKAYRVRPVHLRQQSLTGPSPRLDVLQGFQLLSRPRLYPLSRRTHRFERRPHRFDPWCRLQKRALARPGPPVGSK